MKIPASSPRPVTLQSNRGRPRPPGDPAHPRAILDPSDCPVDDPNDRVPLETDVAKTQDPPRLVRGPHAVQGERGSDLAGPAHIDWSSTRERQASSWPGAGSTRNSATRAPPGLLRPTEARRRPRARVRRHLRAGQTTRAASSSRERRERRRRRLMVKQYLYIDARAPRKAPEADIREGLSSTWRDLARGQHSHHALQLGGARWRWLRGTGGLADRGIQYVKECTGIVTMQQTSDWSATGSRLNGMEDSAFPPRPGSTGWQRHRGRHPELASSSSTSAGVIRVLGTSGFIVLLTCSSRVARVSSS